MVLKQERNISPCSVLILTVLLLVFMNPDIMIFRYLKPYIKVLSTNGCNIWLFCVLQLSVSGILLKAQKMLGFCLFRELVL